MSDGASAPDNIDSTSTQQISEPWYGVFRQEETRVFKGRSTEGRSQRHTSTSPIVWFATTTTFHPGTTEFKRADLWTCASSCRHEQRRHSLVAHEKLLEDVTHNHLRRASQQLWQRLLGGVFLRVFFLGGFPKDFSFGEKFLSNLVYLKPSRWCSNVRPKGFLQCRTFAGSGSGWSKENSCCFKHRSVPETFQIPDGNRAAVSKNCNVAWIHGASTEAAVSPCSRRSLQGPAGIVAGFPH